MALPIPTDVHTYYALHTLYSNQPQLVQNDRTSILSGTMINE